MVFSGSVDIELIYREAQLVKQEIGLKTHV